MTLEIKVDENGCPYKKDSREFMIWYKGFKAGRLAEHKDVLERALNFSLPEIKEKLEQIRKQARQEGRAEELEEVEKIIKSRQWRNGMIVVETLLQDIKALKSKEAKRE